MVAISSPKLWLFILSIIRHTNAAILSRDESLFTPEALSDTALLLPEIESDHEDVRLHAITVSEKRDQPQQLVSSNFSCANIVKLNDGRDRWAAAAGDDALRQFMYLWDNNLLYCHECLGLEPGTCTNTSNACMDGLRTGSAKRGNSGERWDVGLWMYAGASSELACGVNGHGCVNSAIDCGLFEGSAGGYVLVDAMTRLSEMLVFADNQFKTGSDTVSNEQAKFSSVFAPLPDYSDARYLVGAATAVFVGAMGFLPGIGAAVGSAGANIANAFGNAAFVNAQKTKPADTNAPLATIINSTEQAMSQASQELFGQGYLVNRDGTQFFLKDWMFTGNLNELPAPPNQDVQQENGFELILYQHLADYTWTWQQSDGHTNPPFIAFANGDCDKLDYTDGKSVPFPNHGLDLLDANVSWGGSCFWLLQPSTTFTTVDNGGIGGNGQSITCSFKSLPGGTNKELSDNSDSFAGLSLIDFIQPSFDGWKQNNKENGYDVTSYADLWNATNRAPGALNITVCDYIGNSGSPGYGCPYVGQVVSDQCQLQTSQANTAVGEFQPGKCHIHLIQYQKNEPENVNSFEWQYQMLVTVSDATYNVIGSAAKEWVGTIIEVWNSLLPYTIFVHFRNQDEDPVEFWYGDQWWTSSNDSDTDFKCSVGKYDSGSRQMDCQFQCDKLAADATIVASPSATIDHPFPSGAVFESALENGPIYTNIYRELTVPTQAAADYPAGTCRVHIEQYRNNTDDQTANPGPSFQMQAYLNVVNSDGSTGAPIAEGENAQVDFVPGTTVTINGIRGFFRVSWPSYSDWRYTYYGDLQFNYDGPTTHLQWNTADHGDRKCDLGNWQDSKLDYRGVSCQFPCD